MPTWDSTLYRQFAAERARPADDLAARVELAAPRLIVDLGCGAGDSTAAVARRWPGALVTGVDSSEEMLSCARADHPAWTWMLGDIADITAWRPDGPVDLIFSNAALQWVPDHERLVPRLFDEVAQGGALAVQMPANFDGAPHCLMRELAASAAWRERFTVPPREWFAHQPEFYYDLLAPRAQRVDVWITEYWHVLDDVNGIVRWYRGTGLRPFLDALPDETLRSRFLDDYRERLRPHFPPRADGKVVFPFRRMFFVAYR